MENLNNYCFLKVDDFFRLVWLVMSEIFKLEKWDLSIALFYLIYLIVFGVLFQSFYHCNILTLYWQFRAIKMFFGSNLILVLTLSYNIIDNLMVLWKKKCFSVLKTVVPSLPPTALCDCQEKKIRSAMLIYHT